MLRDAMQREEEEQGGQGRKVCRSDDCQCVIDGESIVQLLVKVSCVKLQCGCGTIPIRATNVIIEDHRGGED